MSRPRLPGKIYYLGRLRYRPDQDPPELLDLLETISRADPDRRPEIIKAALIGGMALATQEASKTAEDCETENLLTDLFD